MNLELAVQIFTLISVVVAAVGLIVGVVVYRRQMNAQLFLEYTRRYEQIMESFPTDARLSLNEKLPKSSRELTFCVLKYLNLSSEEFYLRRKHYLSKPIWSIWEKELKRTLRSPLLRREWGKLRNEFESYPTFSRYVEETQRS